MKRFLVYLLMLALTVAISPFDQSLAGTARDMDAMHQSHTEMTVSSLSDALEDCCSVDHEKTHHASSSCMMDCHNAIAVPAYQFADASAILNGTEQTCRVFLLSSAQFRPPISI